MEETLQVESEVTEFIEMLKTMSTTEKEQLRGIMIGITLSKRCAS